MIWDTDSIDQIKVDEYYEETRNLAETIDDKPKAIELLKRISYLHHLSNEYYVPNDIEDLRSMALEYLDSPEEYFTEVLYEIIVKTHQNFTKSVLILEDSAIKGELSEEVVFDIVHSFNTSIEETNIQCDKYSSRKFEKYRFRSDELQMHYDEWLDDQSSS